MLALRALAARGSLELVCHRCFLVGSIEGLLEVHNLGPQESGAVDAALQELLEFLTSCIQATVVVAEQ